MAKKFVIIRLIQDRTDIRKEYYCGQHDFTKTLLYAIFYDTYEECETTLKFLPTGIYEIEKIFSVKQPNTMPLFK